MRNPTLHRLICTCLLLLMATPTLAVDRREVEQFMARFDSAFENRDLEAIGRLIDEEARLTLHIYGNDGKAKSVDLEKRGYLLHLKRAWDEASDFSYTRDNLTLYPDGPDTVHVVVDIIESMSRSGKRLESFTAYKATLERTAEGLRLVSLVAHATI